MNRDEKMKKEKRNLRILGVILMILGYGLAFAGMASESPFTILAMIIAFVGIIMILGAVQTIETILIIKMMSISLHYLMKLFHKYIIHI